MDTARETGILKLLLKELFKRLQKQPDLIGNEIAEKITSVGKSKEEKTTKKVEEIYIPSKKRQQIIDDLKLF